MSEKPARRHSDDEADKWFYDLGALAEQITRNYTRTMEVRRKAEAAQRRADTARRRTLLLALFVLFAFFLLAWRSEVNTRQINDSNARISETQQGSCQGGLEILRKFNRQNDALIEVERTNEFIDEDVRAARIKAYREARIDPLPICALPTSREGS